MDDRSLDFAHPLWLAAGVVLAALGLAAFLRADRRRRADLEKLAHPRFHARLVAGWSPALRWTRRVLWLAAVLLLAAAAARPRFGHEWREVKRRGIDILFAVDTSRSMLADDLSPNRLERARLGILDFVGRLEGDRVGLVPFAGSAFALCPLTLDYDAFRESLETLDTDLIPRQGTDLASAIREAERLFDAEENNHRFLVLITDGEDLEGEALDAAKEAAKKGTTIHTVGVGAEDGRTIPVRDRFGREQPLRDEDGEIVRTSLDAGTLRKIAEDTGGLYVPLGRGAEGLDSIYQQRLSVAPKSELAQQLEKVPLERFQWPLGAAVALLLFQALLGERKPERARAALASVARRVRPAAPLVLMLAAAPFSKGAGAATAYNEGTADYAGGEFESAAEKLGASLRTPDLGLQQKAYYNLGNSLYRIGQAVMAEDPEKAAGHWEKSLKAFEDSLALDPADADAEFNRDFVKRKLDELKQQQQDPQQDDSQQDQDEQKDPQDGEKDQEQNQDGDSGKQESGDPQDEQDGSGDEGKPEDGGDESEAGKPEDKGASSEDQSDKPGEKDESQAGGDEEEGTKGQEERQPEQEAARGSESGEAKEDPQEGQQPGEAGAQVREAGEMSREEALRLLRSLGNDERVVVPVPLDEEEARQRDGGGRKRKTW